MTDYEKLELLDRIAERLGHDADSELLRDLVEPPWKRRTRRLGRRDCAIRAASSFLSAPSACLVEHLRAYDPANLNGELR